jgi:hypothetical protein
VRRKDYKHQLLSNTVLEKDGNAMKRMQNADLHGKIACTSTTSKTSTMCWHHSETLVGHEFHSELTVSTDWTSKQITYGLYLSDHSILNDVETELTVLSGIMIQNLPRETAWHLRGTRRIGVSMKDVETLQQCVREFMPS